MIYGELSLVESVLLAQGRSRDEWKHREEKPAPKPVEPPKDPRRKGRPQKRKHGKCAECGKNWPVQMHKIGCPEIAAMAAKRYKKRG